MFEHAQTGLHEWDQNFFGCVLFEYVLYFVEDETALIFNVRVFKQLNILWYVVQRWFEHEIRQNVAVHIRIEILDVAA